MKKLFTQFSSPGGISSHVAPTTPGSIHEGGELGYSLSHAFGAASDNPGLIVACIIGDGEAGGPPRDSLAVQQAPRRRHGGAVLPILHLNGFKISTPECVTDMLELLFHFTPERDRLVFVGTVSLQMRPAVHPSRSGVFRGTIVRSSYFAESSAN